MKHTLLEQSVTIGSVDTIMDDITSVFTEQLGFTQRDSWYFSPIDTKFGVQFVLGSDDKLYMYITFDGGLTYKTFFSIYYKKENTTKLGITQLHYHVSKGGNVIYLGFVYNSAVSLSSGYYWRSLGIVFSVDESGDTVAFRGQTLTSSYSEQSSAYVYMYDKSTTGLSYGSVVSRSDKVKSDYHSAIYKYPSISNCCMHNELYGIVNVQAYTSITNSFITFEGQVYRIVSCSDTYYGSSLSNDISTTCKPYFAFPVSD